MTREQARAVRLAVRAWVNHKPHQALDILQAAGFDRRERDAFVRQAVRAARAKARRVGVAR